MTTLRRLKAKSLSNHDIENALNGKTNIVVYEDLKNVNSIEDILKPYGCCVVLYQKSPIDGHWVVINKRKNCIEFFDSYGMFPDDQLQYASYPGKEKVLLKLLEESPMPVSWNPYKLQSEERNINVCGRWCVLRVALAKIPLVDFVKMFIGGEMKPDDYVTILTSFI